MLEQKDLKMISEMVRQELHPVKKALNGLWGDTKALKTTLEIETNIGLRVLADEHSELRRKLNEALMFKGEKELLLIRLNHLESEVKGIKARLKEIA